MTPELVKRAVVADLIPAARADRYLRDRQAPEPWLPPKCPPPPERSLPVHAVGRRKMVRSRMTRQLIAARVLVPSVAHSPAEPRNP